MDRLLTIARDWPLGTRVRKANPDAPEWQAVVVGYYSSTKTPVGLVLECTVTGARWQVHVEPAGRMEKCDD